MHDDPTAPHAASQPAADAPALERAMRRGLELADEGPAWGPNPRVGCVILDDRGRVIAEGRHRGAGSAHAEVDALRQLPAGGARGSTAVVTLEPCNHTGRTGPCAAALIEAGVARVAYAVADPGAESSGGAARLRAAGIEVTDGVLADEAAAFLRVWLGSARLGRPFVTAKWASSLDGRIAAADGTSRWITGPAAREDVHRRRAEADAILVGTGTVLADAPALSPRAGPTGSRTRTSPRPSCSATARSPTTRPCTATRAGSSGSRATTPPPRSRSSDAGGSGTSSWRAAPRSSPRWSPPGSWPRWSPTSRPCSSAAPAPRPATSASRACPPPTDSPSSARRGSGTTSS